MIKKGFTLIELLVTIAIIGVLVTLVTFGLRQAQESSRDSKRKADLETIAAGIELYRADCNGYPTSDFLTLGTLTGSGTCSGTYITQVPTDPRSPSRRYYYSGSVNGYTLCTALEQASGTVTGCGGSTACGTQCNYKITRP